MQRIVTQHIAGLAIAAAVAGAPMVHGQVPQTIRVGFAISMTGPNSFGAKTTVIPNYRLWAKEVNAAGGIMLSRIGKRLPVTLVEYDARSTVDDAVADVQRLITVDKVDFILPPWGTRLNIAVGPLFYRAGYPLLAVTALSDEAPELGKRWPNSFWFLGTMTGAARALAGTLSELRAAGKVGDRLAMVNVADRFGVGLAAAGRRIFKKNKFEIVYDRPYPVETTSMVQIIAEVKRLDPDIFVAFSYPADTMAITEAARAAAFNPKVFYTAVGTAYAAYRQHFGADAEGVMGIGGWDADAPASREYFRRFVAANGEEPDRWASPVTYASLQMLQQAIERVGRIDRAAVIKELQTGTFATVLGPVKMQDNLYTRPWYVGQWQHGEFYGLAPATLRGAHQVMFPKPPWHANPGQ